jgi:hypothetical protein
LEKFSWKSKHSVKCKFWSDCSLSKANLINYIAIHNKIRASGLYNFQDCRIPVFSRLNISYIRQKLLNYSDYQVFDFLEYGWPVGHNGSSLRSSSCRNHTGATYFPEQSTSYLIKEASYQAVVGPFKDNPFNEPIALSPLNSVPEKDFSERRVIVELSFPEGESVNFGILKDDYLGNKISVSYPKVDDFINLIM